MEISEIPDSSGEDHKPLQILVRIDRGELPHTLLNAQTYGTACQVSPTEYLLRVPGVAGFYAHHGQQVLVDPHLGVSAADVSTYLLGSVFGALCHQNGMLPLHASAVAGQDGVTAFLADSGAGKSTLAAFLQRRGYPIVADDICLLRSTAAGPGVVPVAGWLKLWRQSFEQLGQTPDERNRTFSADDKYRIYLGQPAPVTPRLANAVFLERCADVATPRLEPLSAAAALARLLDNIYLGYITEITGAQPQAFRQCAAALAGARAWRLIAPFGWHAMEATLDLVAAELLGKPA